MENNSPQPSRSGHRALLLFSMLLLAALSHAEWWGILIPDLASGDFWSQPVSACMAGPPDQSWMAPTFLALIVFALVAAIGYNLSGLLGARVQAWSKDLLYRTAKSAIIVVFIFSGYYLTSASPGGLLYQGLIQLQNALNVAETVRNTLLYEFGFMTAITALMSMIGNLTPYFRPAGIIGISFSVAPAFRPLFDALGVLLSTMAVAVAEWFVHVWMLCFIKTKMLALFLPVGLFLRAFRPTVRAGDVLIAIVIGFYFVYPFMLNLSGVAMLQYLNAEFTDAPIQDIQGGHYLSFEECALHQTGNSRKCFMSLSFKGVWRYLSSFVSSNLTASLGVTALVLVLSGSAVSSFLVTFLIFFIPTIIKASTFYILVVSTLLPLFNLFVTLTVIKEIAQFLGTPVDFSAFEKLF